MVSKLFVEMKKTLSLVSFAEEKKNAATSAAVQDDYSA